MMTKQQFILNIIFFIPFMVINFFLYGITGCADFIELLKENKKVLDKATERC